MSFASASLGASAHCARTSPLASRAPSSIHCKQQSRSRPLFAVPSVSASSSPPPPPTTTTTLDRRRRQTKNKNQNRTNLQFHGGTRRIRRPDVRADVNPFDLAWGTTLPSDLAASVDPQQLAANLFAFSIVPYAGFLFHLHRSRAAPNVTLFGFYFLLVFVFATIPAGIYAKTHYGKILADVDWLHGSAESLLTLTNLLVVVGLRQALREAEERKARRKREKGEARGGAGDAEGVSLDSADDSSSSTSSAPVEK